MRHGPAFAILVVVAGALLHGAPASTTHILTDGFQCGPGRSDAFTFLWGHWWVHTALDQARSPFHCDWVLPPTGADLRFHSVGWVTAFLTWPLSYVAPEVALYNLSILLLLAGGAFAMYLSLRVTFDVSPALALGFGALFGMCPYFVFKAHVHPNLVGGVFWGSAIAALLHAVVRRTDGWREPLLFGAAFWLCFWNSLVEWAMLVAVVAVVVVAATATTRFRPGWRWIVPVAAGLPGLLLFTRSSTGVDVPLFPAAPLRTWLSPPILSVFSDGRPDGPLLEYAGLGVPWGLTALAALGLVLESDRRLRILLGTLLVALLLLAFDPLGILSGAFRSLPLGAAVRVFARFYPFALFPLVVLAARGAAGVFRERRAGPLRWVVIAAVALAVVETVPARVHREQAVFLDLPAGVRDSLDRSRRVMVLPSSTRSYPRKREAYQVELDMKFVQMGHLTRESPEAKRERSRAFPIVFGDPPPPAATPDDLRRELARLNVGYVILDQPDLLARFPFPARVLHRGSGAVLLALDEDGGGHRSPAP
jgi:hypothetical protein